MIQNNSRNRYISLQREFDIVRKMVSNQSDISRFYFMSIWNVYRHRLDNGFVYATNFIDDAIKLINSSYFLGLCEEKMIDEIENLILKNEIAVPSRNKQINEIIENLSLVSETFQ